MQNKILIGTLILLMSQPLLAERLFRAEYQADYKGLPVKAIGIRELTRLEDNHYRLVSSAKSALLRVSETSEFTLQNGLVQPRSYYYQRRGIGRKKSETVGFDWVNMIASHGDTTSPLDPGTLDKLTYQYQMRLDVAAGEATALNYLIADEEKRKNYAFNVIGEDTIDTPAGEFQTIKLQRVRAARDDKGQDRVTTIWLAKDHHYLLTRLKQEENGKGFELNLTAFTFQDD